MKQAMQHPRDATSSSKAKRILVLGGKGFIGGHIVRQINAEGSAQEVIIGTRSLSNAAKLRTLALHQMTAPADWHKTLEDIDIVVNAVGILRQRPGESYEAVHHHAVQALVSACEIQGKKLIHISALGLENPVKAPFSVSKKHGEQALINSGADWHIIRASLVEGEGAYGGSWFKRISKWPVHFVPQKHAYVAPVRVEHIALKVQQIIESETTGCTRQQRIHEVSNGIKYLLPDYLIALNGGKARPRITVPDFLVRLSAWICDRLNFTPLTEGHHELLCFDNCPMKSQLLVYQPGTAKREQCNKVEIEKDVNSTYTQ